MNPYKMGYTLFHRLRKNGSFKHEIYKNIFTISHIPVLFN